MSYETAAALAKKKKVQNLSSVRNVPFTNILEFLPVTVWAAGVINVVEATVEGLCCSTVQFRV